MSEREGAVTMKGNPLTLTGNELKPGDAAPDFTLTANDLTERKLSDYAGKTVILSCVPSLDTPTCDTQSRTFNEKAASLGDDVVLLTVSRDLPFAQKRWCGQADAKNIEALSDYKDASFGKDYGILIKELALLARAVYVVDKDGKIKYVQLVPEVSEEPNYDEVLAAV